jgi:hypothetical protein
MFSLKFKPMKFSIFLTGAIAFATFAAQAQVDPAKLPAAKAAADKFIVTAKGSEKSGAAPRQSDPAVMQMLDTVFDMRDVQNTHGIPFQQLSPLTERMMTAVKVGVIYMLAGTGATEISQLDAVPDATVKVNLNVIKFAPEMGRFFDFQARIQAAVVEAVLTRVASAKPEELARPNFQSGLADIRQGSQRTASSLIETLAVNGITDEWRRDRIPALTAMAPGLAKFLQAEQKSELQKLALACAEVMDDAQVKQGLKQFAKTIANG